MVIVFKIVVIVVPIHLIMARNVFVVLVGLIAMPPQVVIVKRFVRAPSRVQVTLVVLLVNMNAEVNVMKIHTQKEPVFLLFR